MSASGGALTLASESAKAPRAFLEATSTEGVARHAAAASSSQLLWQSQLFFQKLGGVSVSSAFRTPAFDTIITCMSCHTVT